MKKLTLILLGLMLMPFLWLASSCSDDNDPTPPDDDFPCCTFPSNYKPLTCTQITGTLKAKFLCPSLDLDTAWYIEPLSGNYPKQYEHFYIRLFKTSDERTTGWKEGMTVHVDSIICTREGQGGYVADDHSIIDSTIWITQAYLYWGFQIVPPKRNNWCDFDPGPMPD